MFLAIIAFAAISLVFWVLGGIPVMFLWNWLMPAIFGLPTISIWQAIGLSVLCGILFKSSSSSSNKGDN